MRCFPLFQFLRACFQPLQSSTARWRVRLSCGMFLACLAASMCAAGAQAQDDSLPASTGVAASADSLPTTPAVSEPLQPKAPEEQAVQPARLSSKTSNPSKSAKSSMGRLPRYYSGLVDSQQRQLIYDIRLRMSQQIEALELQLEGLRAEEMQAMEAVLTSQQREQLAVLRAQASPASRAPTSN